MKRRILRLILFLAMSIFDDVYAKEFVVSESSDNVPGSLRAAIDGINASSDVDNVITFATPTVTVSSALPTLVNPVMFVVPASGVSVVGSGLINGTALFAASESSLGGLVNGMVVSASGGSKIAAIKNATGAVHISGDMAAALTTTTTSSWYSYGIHAGDGSITVDGNLSGSITATAKTNYAYGLRAVGAATIGGDLSGTIAVTAGTGYRAYGISSDNATTIGGSLSGAITAVAGSYSAYGIKASALYVGTDISGAVTSTAGTYDACGLTLGGSLTVGGDISGTISASALDGDKAYAIKTKSAISIGGEVSGTLTATASGSDAAGLYCFDSSIHGATSSDPARISGSINAVSSGASAAVMAWTEMNLYVTGTLYAEGASAYAIRSGMFNGTGGFTDNTTERVDTVVLASGAVLTGGVYLGDGDDTLMLSGTADIQSVPSLDGGTGDDRLVFSGWSGSFSDAMQGWEHLDVGSGSSLGMDALGSFSGEVSVLEGAVLRPGAAGGRDRIAGSLLNLGLIELRDGNAHGVLTVDGSYTGGGVVGMDVGAGSADLLSVSGAVSGTTTLLLSIAPSVTELAAAEPSLLIHTDTAAAADAFVVQDATDYGPYVAGVMVVAEATGSADWYYGVSGLHDDALTAQALMPVIAGPLEDFVPRFSDRKAYGGSSGVMPGFGGGWTRAGESWSRTVLSGDAGTLTDGTSRFVQLGWDLWYALGAKSYRGAGVFGGTGTQSASVVSTGGRPAGGVEGTNYSGGIYAFLVRPRSYRLEVAAVFGYHELSLNYEMSSPEHLATGSRMVSAEGELQLGLGEGLALSPRLQAVWRHVDGFGLAPLSTGPLMVEDEDGLIGLAGLGLTLNTDCPGWYLVAEATVRVDGSPTNAVRYPLPAVTLSTEAEAVLWGGSLTVGNRAGGMLDPVYWLKAGALGSAGSMESYRLSLEAGVKVPF
ncbi:autotransporter outer membrane beta-barrel domain-containing protein [Pelodictyon luteolum]|uniref:Outer membrane autotransporter barrel n=1 Tax=Chlorobium luteolum (strain DSM 273 / BCRC 81028 / 2530) TaxID=319225 RepID=Q3B684_CHLL3|nr:autotransporter outer membrane beta-barrel domain-containing protein [Pelodictyon luteolum]ABB23147.1 Outer membrane autotransporter barrel [Pelodictyon luteolum DSM 273]